MARRRRNGGAIAVSIISGILCVVAIIALLPSVFWVYLKTHPEKTPETHVTTYVSTIVDEKGEERQFIEVEYWENLGGNGKRILEISFNAYSGQDMLAIKRMGVQYNLTDGSAWNYTQDGGASWKSLATEQIDVGTPMYIKIGDQPISVTMDGTYTEYNYNFNFVKSVKNFFRWSFNNDHYKLDIHDKSFGHTVTETVHPYKMEDFYRDIYNAVIYNNVGYGGNILSLVDLSKYFTLKKRVDGVWQNIENYQEHQNEYFSIKVVRHREGLMRAKDSAFGMCSGDAEFTLIKTDNLLNEYAGIDENVILTYEDFDYRYCKDYGGYVAYIKDAIRNTLSINHIDTVAINLDLSNSYFKGSGQPIIGIMYDFANISSVTLTFEQTTFPRFFEFYDKSVGRQYIPVDALYTVHNRANDKYVISHFSEVEV